MARPVYQYKPVEGTDTAIGILLPLNKGAQGRPIDSAEAYTSGSRSGNGVFVSSYTTKEAAISNLKNLILTEKGERYMQPNFGTNIRTILFDNNTEDLRDALQDSIDEDVQFWLPYIKLQNTNITSSVDMQALTITLLFQITNIGANVVINILATENAFEVTESEPGEEELVEVDTFGSDTAFNLGGGGTY